MITKHLITVIIPVYNVEKYLNRCIESIINQTYKNLEIILVDDGSTDNSGKICDEYALKDNRIKVIHKQNGGVSSARNKGLEVATGEYIGFVDSDDYIEKDMYEYLYNGCVFFNAQISSCSTLFEGKVIDKQKREFYIQKDFIENFNTFPCSVWNRLFKKDLIYGLRFDEHIFFGEDLLFSFFAFFKSQKVCFLKENKYNYISNTNSLSRIKFNVKKLDCFKVTEIIKEFAKNNKLDKVYKAMLNHESYHAIGFLRQIIETNFENKEIIKYLQQKVKKNILIHLFSKHKLSNKLFAISVCVNFKLTSKIYKFINS